MCVRWWLFVFSGVVIEGIWASLLYWTEPRRRKNCLVGADAGGIITVTERVVMFFGHVSG